MPADPAQPRAEQPSATKIALDLTLSLLDDRAQHVV
jgi:hypothetical protein